MTFTKILGIIIIKQTAILICSAINLFSFTKLNSDKLYKLPTLPCVILNSTSYIIGIMFFRRRYQRRNSKRKYRVCVSSLISRSYLMLVCRLLWGNSLWHSQHNEYCFILIFRNFGLTDCKMLWRKFNVLFSLCCTTTTNNYPASNGLMKNIPTTQETLC